MGSQNISFTSVFSSVFSGVLSSVFIYLFNNSEVLKEPSLFILVQAIIIELGNSWLSGNSVLDSLCTFECSFVNNLNLPIGCQPVVVPGGSGGGGNKGSCTPPETRRRGFTVQTVKEIYSSFV